MQLANRYLFENVVKPGKFIEFLERCQYFIGFKDIGKIYVNISLVLKTSPKLMSIFHWF